MGRHEECTKFAEEGSFQQLSVELIASILRQANPMDIVVARQTCRAVYHATQIREVWVDILARLCARNGIFRPSFPIEDMTKLELEHAATAPFRFLRRFQAMSPETYPKYMLQVQRRQIVFPQWKPPLKLNGWNHVDRFVLVPGGRFLLVSTKDHVYLLDLGYNTAKTSSEPFPLAGAKLGFLEAVFPSSEGNEILIASQRRSESHLWELCIAQIDPLSAVPDFRVLGKMHVPVPGRLSPRPVEGVRQVPGRSRVAFQCGGSIGVWDWIKNTGCRWTRKGQGTQFSELIHACSTSVLAYSNNGTIYTWSIPTDIPSPPCSAWPQFSTIAVELCVIKDRKEGDPLWAILCSSPSIWQQSTSSQSYMCLLYHDQLKGTNDHICRVYSITEDLPAGPRGQTHAPVQITDVGYGSTYAFSGSTTDVFQLDDKLFLCTSSEAGSVVMSTATVPSSTTGNPEEALHTMNIALTPMMTRDKQIEFCPFSGRLVYTSGSFNQVFISDHLSPSPEDPEAERNKDRQGVETATIPR